MLQPVLFVAGSAALVTVSWRSMRHRRAHGFYRFFAFELILNLAHFGASYADYMKRSRRFVPFVF